MPELVSILIPAYNAERWIADTIESVLAQDWPHKELIIVDDGSTDDTLAIARSFSADNVKVVSQPNAGASAARNRALSLARGDYIQWLDADDLLAPDKLSRQLRGAKPGATSRVLLSSSFGEFFADPADAEFVPNSLWQDLSPIDFLLNRFTQNAWMCPAVWLVSRRLIEAAGRWDERLSLDDDGEYFSRVAAHSEQIRFVPEARSYYRRGLVGSLSRTVSTRACDSLLLSLSLCISHLRSLEDSTRTRAAGLALLQAWTDHSVCFYPDRQDLQQKIEALAQELGGSITPQRLDWKYSVIRALLGWSAVRRAKTTVSNARLLARGRIAQLRQSNARRTPPLSSRTPLGSGRTGPDCMEDLDPGAPHPALRSDPSMGVTPADATGLAQPAASSPVVERAAPEHAKETQ